MNSSLYQLDGHKSDESGVIMVRSDIEMGRVVITDKKMTASTAELTYLSFLSDWATGSSSLKKPPVGATVDTAAARWPNGMPAQPARLGRRPGRASRSLSSATEIPNVWLIRGPSGVMSMTA